MTKPTRIHLSDLPEKPWKNGGGVTTEIAVFPPGADMDTFDWRVSTALVAQDGPFSAFPGVTRWLFLSHGDGFVLDFADGTSLRIDETGPVHEFDGGIGTDCTLIGGESRDINVMARSGVGMSVARLPAGRDAPPVGMVDISPDGVVIRLEDGRILSARRI
ncbi:HutD family protein [Rhodospirillaceae bacterium KN72]|uniref:HutD family protein n=1 Tax=Pacificispira spongiicola TaxID=2729598 RepID=A0A7Y0DWP7_9PROT|nr:HutD family protein [Pacificispira spongiicola]NMM43015.1 HutD family protein [Pacificispira spongiicola]